MKRPWRIWVNQGVGGLTIYAPGFGSQETALASVQARLDKGEFRNFDGIVCTNFMARRIYVGTMRELGLCRVEDGKVILGDVPTLRQVG